MKVSIIIPNYNGERLIRENLPKVISQASAYEAEIIIVDDRSSDKSIKEIKNQKSKVKNNHLKIHLIENEKNLGFSSTVNRGVERASGEYIVLLNSDTYPLKGFLDFSFSHFQDKNVFAVGFLQKCLEGNTQVSRGRGIGSFQKGFLVHSKGEIDKNNTLWVSGGAAIFRKTIWDKLNGLCELYNPFYWEDIDLSYRALKNGYKLIFEKKCQVVHKQKSGAIRSKYSEKSIKQIAYRNQILFVWLNITDPKYLLDHLLYLPINLARAVFLKDFAFLKGLILALGKIDKVFSIRRENQKGYQYSDKKVLEQFCP